MKLRILLSFHYYKDTDLDALFTKYFTPPYPDVFVDSGGFSAMTQGAEIDLDAYCAYLRRFAPLIQVYANLDVVGNAEATLANQKRMEDKGLRPLPVFHVGEPWEYLERYIEEYPYIALGGMVPHMRFPKRIMPWLVRCFKMAQGKSVFHGFGATSWTIVSALPWYSVDSSSWGMGFRFGQVPLFDEQRGRFMDAHLGDAAGCYKLAPLFRSLGFDPADFADRARNDRAKICAISALSYMKAEQWLRKRHGEVHIPGRDGAPVGLRAHLVTAQSNAQATLGSNMSLNALGKAFGDASAGPRLHLSDTSNGVNLGDADKGLKVHLADARGPSGGDLAAAEAGLKIHLVDTAAVSDIHNIVEGLRELGE